MMDNTNYLLEFNVPGCSSGYEKIGNFNIPLKTSHIACFCCLATNVPVVNASKCNHTEFVKLYFKMKNATGLWICCICHYMLKKIELFRFQIYKSFNNLNRKLPQDSNWKLINELTTNNTSSVSILSIVKPEPQTDDHKDPLEDTNTNNQQDIEVKIEQEYDSDTNSTTNNNQDFEGPIDTYTHTKTNISPIYKCDDTNTEASQNLNLMKMISLTPIRQQKKENPLLKTMLSSEGPFSVQNYIKILPKPDSVSKSKAPNTLIVQDTHVEEKLAATQKERCQNLVTAEETTESQEKLDKVYNLLHKPSNVIDATYEGKIMEHNITQEQLDMQRYAERNKEAFQTAKYKCDSCVKVFEYEFTMDRHNARQHKEANLKLETVCTICKCVYSKATYKNHFKKHFTRFVCVVCNEDSTDLPKLALHFNQSHPGKEPIPLSYWCNECDFKTDEVLKYRQHRKTHRTQKCNICNKVIYVKMRIHMKSHHSEETASKRRTKPTKSYKCQHCERSYVLPSTLRNHVRMSHGSDTNTYYCEKCDKQFKTEAIYRVHLAQSSAHASIEEVFKYICDFCGKKTKYKDVMESHIEREHLKTQRFRCEPCNKIFGSDKFLQRHINFVHNKHKLPKNKICQYCGKAFAIMLELRAHLLSHTDERPLSCELCNKTYRHGSALRYHRTKVHKIPPKRKIE